MRYTVYHLTHFRYDAPVSESVMEVRMQPRTESVQRCLRFELATTPRSRVFAYQDPEGNVVHHFDVPARHRELTVVAESVVEFVSDIADPRELRHGRRGRCSTRAARASGSSSSSSRRTSRGRPRRCWRSAANSGCRASVDPLSLLRSLKHQLYDAFEYAPKSTRVDSPIDDALAARRGVCQDFAHVMIALVREHGHPVPLRERLPVPQPQGDERSVDGASHAWVEAWLPTLGWVGIDPTNKTLAMDRHIRVAIGRDYHDVPPTRGVLQGQCPQRTRRRRPRPDDRRAHRAVRRHAGALLGRPRARDPIRRWPTRSRNSSSNSSSSR